MLIHINIPKKFEVLRLSACLAMMGGCAGLQQQSRPAALTQYSEPAQLEKLLADPKAANAALGGGKAEAKFQQAYHEFVSLPSERREFRRLFIALGDQKQLPALFHCTPGKDRTGWAAAALLTLLGVPKDRVMEDYLRSNDYILPAYRKGIDAFVARRGETSRFLWPSWA